MSKRPRFIVRNVGGKTPLGNKRGPWFVLDAAREDRVTASWDTRRRAVIDARVLNALAAAEPDGCPRYQPDHNGECLLCDEWLDCHSAAAIEAGQHFADAQTPSIPRGTKKL
jgi:hypothetical protein